MESLKENQMYNILSPDGFPISRDEQYATIKEAKKAFNEWKKRFKSQGYYSSSRDGRIELKYLHEYCDCIIQEKFEDEVDEDSISEPF